MSNPTPIPQNTTPTPTPQTATKKPIILISTIVGLVLLSIVAGVVAYQSKMTETKMTSKSSSSLMSQMGMGQSNMANSMMSMSMAENKSAMATGNLSKFTDPELPGFGLSHDSSWKHEVTKFEEGNGSGGPAGDFYTKSIRLSKGNAALSLSFSTGGRSGIGLSPCFKSGNLIIKGSKYTAIQNLVPGNSTSIELNENIVASTEADFEKYFKASDAGFDTNNKISDYAICIKPMTKMSQVKTSFKGKDGKVINEAVLMVYSEAGTMAQPEILTNTQLKEIVTILDTIVGVSQVNI